MPCHHKEVMCVCFPEQFQEHGGYTRGRAVTQAVVRARICSFVWGGTGRAFPEPNKMTYSKSMVCMFVTKLFVKKTS